MKRAWELLRRHQVAVNILRYAANQDHPLEVYRFFRDELGAEFKRGESYEAIGREAEYKFEAPDFDPQDARRQRAGRAVREIKRLLRNKRLSK